jgi:hypothetical protein
LVQKFIFDIFQLFFVEEEREDTQFWFKKMVVNDDSDHQKVEISVNGFHFMRVVLPRCFFFFSLLDEANLTKRMFLGSG